MKRVPNLDDFNATLIAVSAKRGAVRFPIYEDTYDVSIKDLPIGERELNGLRRAHIETIGQLAQRWNELSGIRNVGGKTVARLRYALCRYTFENIDDTKKFMYLQRIVDLNQI